MRFFEINERKNLFLIRTFQFSLENEQRKIERTKNSNSILFKFYSLREIKMAKKNQLQNWNKSTWSKEG